MADVSKARKFDWVEYAGAKEEEYGKEARKFHEQGYRELAMTYAGRCMALQEMLEAGGYPECVSRYDVDGRKM